MRVDENKQVLDLAVRTYRSGEFISVQLVLAEIRCVVTLGFPADMDPDSSEASAFNTLVARLPDVLKDLASRKDGDVVLFDFTTREEASDG